MSFVEISNENLTAKIHLLGAEPFYLALQGGSHNWLWSAAPLWQRSAPLLFPIVGKLEEDSYEFQGNTYKLPQHGFTRDSEFEIIAQSKTSVHLRLISNAETLKVYPFKFELNVFYSLEGVRFKMKCTLKNLGEGELFYNFGWHPGFVLPQQTHKIKFCANGEMGSFHRLNKGLIDSDKFEFQKEDDLIELASELFEQDALVFLENRASEFIIQDESGARLTLRGSQAPNFGLWTKDIAKFICLEPWWGHASLVDEKTYHLENKIGIRRLQGEACLAELELEPHF